VTASSRPALRGAAWALLAAGLFGASTPFVQQAGAEVGPFATAGLLYAGAAGIGALSRRPAQQEARLRCADLPRLLTIAFFGALVGPVALAWGLQRTSGASASLMLTLEAVFTALLAWRLYGEGVGARVGTAMVLLVSGGVLLVLDQGHADTAELSGLLAVTLATAAWGVDNALSRALAERDPGRVVFAKATLGAAAAAVLTMALGEPLPTSLAAFTLVVIGASGYGLSLRCYLLAQRAFGASRAASVFAFAPFIGAGVALMMGERALTSVLVGGGLLMLAGVVVHLAETHSHEHHHEALEHEHAHRHDDGHHNHTHDPMPTSAHSHVHAHEPLHHTHPHVPDHHHTHRH
jgi:drug/metabolite transporter (DMT)-like permease